MDINNLCMGCMNDIGMAQLCPHCGFESETKQGVRMLAYRTVLSGRYVVGYGEAEADGVNYMGYDLQTGSRVVIREFLPNGHAAHVGGGTDVLVQKGSELLFHDGKAEFLNLWRKLAQGRNLQALIPVLDIFEENGTAYSVSEYIDTITLRDFLLRSRTGYLSWEKSKSIFMPLFTTIASLHRMGVIHRAISPNTLVLGRDGKLRLTGFQIAEATNDGTKYLSKLNPGYPAIEQYSDVNDTGPWTDVYSLAAVLYRTLIGSTPIEATERITNDKLMIPPKFAEVLPAYVVSALENALTIEPGERTQNIDDFREEISGSPSTIASNQISNKTVVRQAPTTPEEKAERRRLERLAAQEQKKEAQTKTMIITFVIVILVGLLVAGGYFGVRYFQENPREEKTTVAASEIIEVPDFVGQSYARITGDEVQQSRFNFKVVYEYSATYEKGVIMAQSIAEGEQVEKGTDLTLTVSNGVEIVTIPSLVGSTYSDAERVLTQAGLKVKKIEKANDGKQTPDVVVAVTPDVGKQVAAGTEVYVQVWGPVPTTTTQSIVDRAVDTIGNLLPQ